MPPKKILIVEDEPAMVRLLRDNLVYEGYEVLVATDGEVALTTAFEQSPDLILLDIMLPKLDGLTICKRLRERHLATPILMLTARNLEQDKVTGLKIGADDYLTKPFSLAELLARTEAILRRAGTPRLETFQFGDITVNFTSFEAIKNGRALDLSPREFEILRYLVEHRGQVVSRSEMLDRIWGYTGQALTRTVDSHIANLRQKIEDLPSQPLYIQTVHRIGYKFTG
ncbi:MAG: response regulator transcription factor [Acidobacteria bacterium]|nr:response regulator transcription factor [Acidobacteriota bacterium]